MNGFPPAFERVASLEDALSGALAEINRLNFRSESNSFDDREYTTSYCTLIDSDGRVRSRAAGKGDRRQSEVGCYFEALQHFYTSGFEVDNYHLVGASLAKASIVSAQAPLQQNRMIQNLAQDYPDATLGVVEMRRFGLPADVIRYPIFPTDARYWENPLPGDSLEYGQYLNYAGTSGSAAGVTPDEALLHAICEIIERDAHSLALIEWFGSAKPYLRIVDKSSLQEEIADVYDAACAAGDGPVTIVDITSDLGIPVFMAMRPSFDGRASVSGLGCSLSPDYALYRALTEMIQGCHARSVDPDFYLSEDQAVVRLSEWPTLVRMFRCDLAEVVERAEIVHGPLREAPTNLDVLSLNGALAFFRDALAHRGYNIYWRTASVGSEHVSVVTVAVPGLEEFYKVAFGYPVTPTGRGWEKWTEILGLAN